MPRKPKMKMPVAQRAKQFMPFSALKGLQEALEKKEHLLVSKPALSEEQYLYLNEQLYLLKKGDLVTIVYYSSGSYVKLTGIVATIDAFHQILKIETPETMVYSTQNITEKKCSIILLGDNLHFLGYHE